MTATTSRRIAPRSPSARRPSPVAAAPIPSSVPAAFGWHTLVSDGGNTVELTLSLPFAADERQEANLQVSWKEPGAEGESEKTEFLSQVPVSCLDDLAENLTQMLALARLHGLLPPRA